MYIGPEQIPAITIEARPDFLDPQESFESAITDGRLSADPTSPVYAGHYMYMGHWDGKASFKHADTMEYLKD